MSTYSFSRPLHSRPLLNAGAPPNSGLNRLRIALGVALVGLLVLAAPPAVAEEVVASGQWTAGGYKIDGSWSIVRDGGTFTLVLDDAFFTKNGPDLKIFLSPRSFGEVTNRNASEGARLVAVLDSNRGAQRYSLPGDPASFRSLVIHCEKYSKLWGGADLR